MGHGKYQHDQRVDKIILEYVGKTIGVGKMAEAKERNEDKSTKTEGEKETLLNERRNLDLRGDHSSQGITQIEHQKGHHLRVETRSPQTLRIINRWIGRLDFRQIGGEERESADESEKNAEEIPFGMLVCHVQSLTQG